LSKLSQSQLGLNGVDLSVKRERSGDDKRSASTGGSSVASGGENLIKREDSPFHADKMNGNKFNKAVAPIGPK
jgi:hypothetical protein